MHRVATDRSAGVVIVAAGGELDAYGAPDLAAAFEHISDEGRVVVDLGAVSFLDSTALGVVVRAVRDVEARGGSATVVLPTGSARRIFEITALDRALPISPSRAAALAVLAAA